MLRLSQARRKDRTSGQPIHMPFSVMRNNGIFFRRGSLSLIAGGPGTGKSAFLQFLLQKGNGLEGEDKKTNSVLYFSADSDVSTMVKRALAIETGWEQDEYDRLIREGRGAELDAIVDTATAHMEWSFASSPDDKEVMNAIEGYAVKYGTYPQALAFDNLKNFFFGEGGEFEALEGNCEFMHDLARDTGAAVIALHHVTGENEDGMKPIPLSGLRGKVSKTPATVVTLHRTQTHLMVSPVKNRDGRAEASGKWVLPLTADLARMQYAG